MDLFERLGTTRARVAWWLFVGVLGATLVFVVYSFVGTVTLGVFLFYASRPAFRRVRARVPSDGVAAMITLLVATVPILVLLVYTAATALLDVVRSTNVGPEDAADLIARYVLGEELSGSGEDVLLTLVRNPGRLDQVSTDFVAGLVSGGLQTVGIAAGVLVHLGLAFAIAFALLRDGDDLAHWAHANVAGDDSTAYAYGTAVDRDLQTVYYGNVLFVFAVAIIAAVVYHGFNFLAPAPLTIPTPTLLALLTGITSLIPLVVGKVVYVPLVALLGYRATQADGSGLLAYPLALLVVAFFVLDILPQTFLQPYLAGRRIGTELMMFAYILGPLLFGWYGFFLLPLILVLLVQAARIVVVELIHGDRLTTAVNDAESVGADPEPEGRPAWAEGKGDERGDADASDGAPETSDADDSEDPSEPDAGGANEGSNGG